MEWALIARSLLPRCAYRLRAWVLLAVAMIVQQTIW
jgi:hypothetical protein